MVISRRHFLEIQPTLDVLPGLNEYLRRQNLGATPFSVKRTTPISSQVEESCTVLDRPDYNASWWTLFFSVDHKHYDLVVSVAFNYFWEGWWSGSRRWHRFHVQPAFYQTHPFFSDCSTRDLSSWFYITLTQNIKPTAPSARHNWLDGFPNIYTPGRSIGGQDIYWGHCFVCYSTPVGVIQRLVSSRETDRHCYVVFMLLFFRIRKSLSVPLTCPDLKVSHHKWKILIV